MHVEQIRFRTMPGDDTTGTRWSHVKMLRARALGMTDEHEKAAVLAEVDRLESQLFKGPKMTGTVLRVFPVKGFGFTRGDDGQEYFFHVNDTDPSVAFDDTLNERRVSFEIEANERGPRAVGVKAAQ